ncbi:MAG: hypothetical protein CVU16_13580 [Betaproteobacteria bacterium HGW-Betaproteobacteria-10]|nr:MAG: hypothetical protein CVU16_13580 [Betaproteobacteria bacterium HGW-Betaproteobacteria-10]
MSIRAKLISSSLIVATVLGLLSTPVSAAVISGPSDLPNLISGHSNTGLRITANQDTTLDSFVYWNQGPDETIFLRNDLTGETLFSIFVVTDSLQQFVDVDWMLEAGQTYRLMIDSSNGRWASNGTPSSNADITVNVAFYSGNDISGYWSSFTQITTAASSQVPEPGTLALVTLSLAGLVLRKRRR